MYYTSRSDFALDALSHPSVTPLWGSCSDTGAERGGRESPIGNTRPRRGPPRRFRRGSTHDCHRGFRNREDRPLLQFLANVEDSALSIGFEEHLSYVADNIVMSRYPGAHGDVENSTGVRTKRFSGFEQSLRRLPIDEDGLRVGDHPERYSGHLTGDARANPEHLT